MNPGCSTCYNCEFIHYSNSFMRYTCNTCGDEFNLCLKCDDKVDENNIFQANIFRDKLSYFYSKNDKIYYIMDDDEELFGDFDMIRVSKFKYGNGVEISGCFYCQNCIDKCDLICPICAIPSDIECVSLHNLRIPC